MIALKCLWPLFELTAIFVALQWLHVSRWTGIALLEGNACLLFCYFRWLWINLDLNSVALEKEAKRQLLETEERAMRTGKRNTDE